LSAHSAASRAVCLLGSQILGSSSMAPSQSDRGPTTSPHQHEKTSSHGNMLGAQAYVLIPRYSRLSHADHKYQGLEAHVRIVIVPIIFTLRKSPSRFQDGTVHQA
jgi:hypothetical protein